MSSRRGSLLALLPAVVILGGAWFLVLAPTRSETSAAQAKLVQATARYDAARAAAALAEQARIDYPSNYAGVAQLAKAVPFDEDVAALVHGLDTIARAHEIDFRAIKLSGADTQDPAPAPAPAGDTNAKAAGADGQAAGADAQAAGANGQATGAEGTAAGADATAPPAGESDLAATAAAAPVGAAGLVTMPFTFTADGGYLPFQRFLQALHARARHANGRIVVEGRLLTIDGFSLAAGRKGFPSVRALVSATAYLEPDPEGVIAGATARAPAPATTAAPVAGAPPAAAR
jgi:hypothetical protein